MKNETQDTLKKYFNDVDISFYGNGNGAHLIADCLQNGNLIYRDAPDLVVTKDGVVLIIEHFEFDCCIATNKGSKNRQEMARIERAIEKGDPNYEGIVYSDTLRAKSSYEYYIKNCTNSFNYHYKQIDRYKSNVIENGYCIDSTPIHVVFLIDDVSPMGLFATNNKNKREPILLAHSPEFLDLLGCSPKVDYIIACAEVENRQFVWCIDSSDVDCYRAHSRDYKTMFFPAMTPQVTGFNIVIPDEDNEE